MQGNCNLMDCVISLAGVSGSSVPHGDSDSQYDVKFDAADNADHLEFSPENIEDSLFLRNLALFYQSIPISSSMSTSISPSFPLSPSLFVSPSISVSI